MLVRMISGVQESLGRASPLELLPPWLSRVHFVPAAVAGIASIVRDAAHLLLLLLLLFLLRGCHGEESEGKQGPRSGDPLGLKDEAERSRGGLWGDEEGGGAVGAAWRRRGAEKEQCCRQRRQRMKDIKRRSCSMIDNVTKTAPSK